MSEVNKPTPASLYENSRAFDGYYYGFSPTNCYPVDVILHAVAKAGKSFHHTEQWGEKLEPYTDHLSGYCPVDWIANAASQAAERLKQLEASNAELLEALQEAKAALEWCVEQGGGPACEHEGGVACFCKENRAINSARAAIAKTLGEQA